MRRTDDGPRLLEPGEAAERLGVSPRTLRRLYLGGQLAAVWITPTRPRIEVAELERFVASRRRTGAAEAAPAGRVVNLMDALREERAKVRAEMRGQAGRPRGQRGKAKTA